MTCILCRDTEIKVRYPIDLKHASQISGLNLSDEKISVVECKKCGHQYIHPPPSKKTLQLYYSNYMSKAKDGFYKDRKDTIISESFRSRYGKWLDEITERIGGNANLLDVGAGLGMFLRFASEKGFRPLAVEPNRDASEILAGRYNIPTINMLFEDISIDESIDVITMWDILEHIPDPSIALSKSKNLLREGGLLVLEIPIRNSFIHKLAKSLYIVSFGRIKRPLYLVCGLHHLHYFTSNEICCLLNNHGFNILKIVREETDINSLYKRQSGKNFILTSSYNLSLKLLLVVARIMRWQNKMIVVAQNQ